MIRTEDLWADPIIHLPQLLVCWPLESSRMLGVVCSGVRHHVVTDNSSSLLTESSLGYTLSPENLSSPERPVYHREPHRNTPPRSIILHLPPTWDPKTTKDENRKKKKTKKVRDREKKPQGYRNQKEKKTYAYQISIGESLWRTHYGVDISLRPPPSLIFK